MLARSAKLCLALLLGAGVSAAQRSEAVQKANQPNATQVNCAGFFSDQKVGGDTYLISGEESSIKLAWTVGEYVHVNRGMNQGVRQGDLYTVTRVESDPNKVMWFKWQPKLLKAMGSPYLDLGQVKIVSVPRISGSTSACMPTRTWCACSTLQNPSTRRRSMRVSRNNGSPCLTASPGRL